MPFADPSVQALIASVDLQVPTMQSPGSGDSVTSGQIVLYFNLTDTKTFRTMAIGMEIFDSRGPSPLDIGIDNGPGGTGALYLVQPAGQPSPYEVVVPGTDGFESVPWTGERQFALEITPGTLSQLISVINANAAPGEQFSTNPADYQLSNVSVDAELEYFGQPNSISFSISNLLIAEAAETISGGSSSLNAVASTSTALLVGVAAGGDTLVAGSGNTTLVGSHDELLVGGPGETTILPGGGHNTIFGGLGGSAVTMIAPGPGDDMIIAGGGTQTIFTGSGADTVWGSADPSAQVVMVGGTGPALFIGGSGPDQIWAGAGSQTLMGGSGDQLLVAGPTSTTMVAGTGRDLMFGGPAGSAATMFGGPSSATMVSEAGADTIVAGAGGDGIFGGVGGDLIETGSGADTVVLSQATARPDTVYLGRGNAAVFGGASPDTYIVTYGEAGGHDVISGFRPGIDHLVFSGYGAAPSVEQTGAGASIALSDGTQILLPGVPPSLHAALS